MKIISFFLTLLMFSPAFADKSKQIKKDTPYTPPVMRCDLSVSNIEVDAESGSMGTVDGDNILTEFRITVEPNENVDGSYYVAKTIKLKINTLEDIYKTKKMVEVLPDDTTEEHLQVLTIIGIFRGSSEVADKTTMMVEASDVLFDGSQAFIGEARVETLNFSNRTQLGLFIEPPDLFPRLLLGPLQVACRELYR